MIIVGRRDQLTMRESLYRDGRGRTLPFCHEIRLIDK